MSSSCRKGIFVTGIDTNIGKTVVSAIISKALTANYWKPIQCGSLENTDADVVATLAPEVLVRPSSYRLELPASPHVAAAKDGVTILLESITLPDSGNRPIVIEGAGGVMVPLNQRHLMLDLMKWLGFPVLLVARNYLGSINHTLLSIAALCQHALPLIGVVFVGESNQGSEEAITQFSGIRKLGIIPTAPSLDAKFVENQAQQEWLRELL